MVATFLILRPRLRAAVEGARQAAEAERAAMAERLQGREELLARTRMYLAGAQADMSTLREELTRQAERRSTAEEKNTRIPELEGAVATKEALIRNLQSENGDLRTRLAEIGTQREEECNAGEEKLALLEDARRQLSDAFRALSAEALRTNNHSFLELARWCVITYTTATSRGENASRKVWMTPSPASSNLRETRRRSIRRCRSPASNTR